MNDFEVKRKKLFSNYTNSLKQDIYFYDEDISGSIAHAKTLHKAGILNSDELQSIVDGLEVIRIEIEEDKFDFVDDLEDLHLNVENRLYELIGEVAAKLHTARSRNDQVVNDTRLYVKKHAAIAIQLIEDLSRAFISKAEQHCEDILPGHTHLQRGQPILLAHYLLAYYEMLQRDKTHFEAVFKVADLSVLGSGAMAGITYALDRNFTAEQLGLKGISRNSIDSVSSRDYIVDYVYASSMCMMHLSRFAGEMVLWASEEFSFVTLDDSVTTGSSIMPQKRNPDFCELLRGKTAIAIAALNSLQILLTGLPLSYNRDLQEDKKPLVDAQEVLESSLKVAIKLIISSNFNVANMKKAAESNLIIATDIADRLVKRGMPFRKAYNIVKDLTIKYPHKRLSNLSIDDIKLVSDEIELADVQVSIEDCISAREIAGGTGYKAVKHAIEVAKKSLARKES